MNPHFTYLLIDVGTILFPLALSFDRKVAFYRCWRALLPAMIISALAFIVWDVLFTAAGVWWFSRGYTLSFRLLGLPVEEWLFFFVVPYACVFIYVTLNAYFPPKGTDGGWSWMRGLGFALIAFAVLNYTRAYTLSALGGCGLAMLLASFFKSKAPDFRADRFLIAYLIALLPFLLVNGLLTSLPVVLYDDAENIGLRIGTIPAEDVWYGMLLILGNIWGMNYFAARGTKHR